MALLEIKNVTKRFGGLLANDDVSLHVAEGEIVGLIGPNGAGKSTLFNSIAGFFPPTAGSIQFDGREIAGLTPDVVCGLGIARTFQLVRIFKEMSVLENVITGALLRSKDAAAARGRAEEVLARTGLARHARTQAGDLPVADQKRVEVARALATGPRLLMLDEALAGLSPTETEQAIQLIQQLPRSGITVLMVEHVMEVIMSICDRVVVLDAGRKIAEGTPAVVSQNPDVIAAYLGTTYHAAD